MKIGGNPNGLSIWRLGKVARHSSVLFGWMLLRAAAQAGTVVLLARVLTTQAYGEFVAVIATATFVMPVVGLGLSHMVLRNAARDAKGASWYMHRALRIWLISALPSVAVGICITLLLLPGGVPIVPVGVVVAAELLSSSMTELIGRYQQARHRISAYGAINAGLPLARLVVLGLLVWLVDSVDTVNVLWAYAIASVGYVGLILPSLRSIPCSKDVCPVESMPLASGVPFLTSVVALRLQGEFNKPILAHAGFGLAGTYNVSQRVVDMASLPLIALQETLLPRLYAAAEPLRQLRRSGVLLLLLALLLGGMVWLAAPLLVWVVGESYRPAIAVLRLLAWLPVLQAVRYLMNVYVIYSGWMNVIGWAYAIGAITSVVSVVRLVPQFGMSGAVVATYVAEAAMAVILMISSLRIYLHARSRP